MKKSVISIALIMLLLFVGCGRTEQTKETSSTLPVAKNTTVSESTTISDKEKSESETTVKQNSNSETTAKPAKQKSAGHTTTKKQSETTTSERQTTTQKVTTTQKPTTTTEKAFDVSYWVSYAKDYARSVGLEVNSSASDCWDNPISANSKCKYLERDIKGMLNRYAKDEDVTQVWIWAEKTSADSYNIYIGYA